MDYKVIYQDLNIDRIRGFVVELDPNRFLIVINSSLPEADQKEALKHELLHIELGHFASGSKANQVEKETHRQIRRHHEIESGFHTRII